MANQSYRQGRPGCSGQNRPVYGPGRPMPYSQRPGSQHRPYDNDLRDCDRNDTDRSGSDCGCSHDNIQPLPADTMCEKKRNDSCGCTNDKAVICISTENFPVGMTYVPMQSWGPLYDHQKAFCQGTLFPELDKPFIGRRACR